MCNHPNPKRRKIYEENGQPASGAGVGGVAAAGRGARRRELHGGHADGPEYVRRRGHGAASRPRLGGQPGLRRGVSRARLRRRAPRVRRLRRCVLLRERRRRYRDARALRRFCVFRRGNAHVPAYRGRGHDGAADRGEYRREGQRQRAGRPRGAHSRRGNGAARRRELHRHAAGRWLYGAQDRPCGPGLHLCH